MWYVPLSSLNMWQWPTQQPTSSAHNHYATSSLPYHRPQAHNIVSPHPHPLPVNPSSQFPPGGHYIYPSSAPTGEFSSLPSPYIANQVPVDGWAEQRQTVQSESVPHPYSSPLQPRGDVHITSPLPTLQPSPIVHPSQQATPTNVQPQPQPSPLPLPPSQTHTVTRSPFSMDFILREHAPPPPEPTEIAQPVVQYPQGARPTSGELHDPVAPGYQMSDVIYQTPPQSHPTLPHAHASSPQLQQTIGQSYMEGGGVKQVTFDPGSHYGDQTKTGLPTFITSGETGERLSVGGFPTTNSPLPEARPFTENLQPFQLHSNYPQPTPGAPEKMDIEPDGNEAPYSPPELIPEGDQSGGLNQSHDHNGPPPRVGEDFTGENQSFTASTYNSHQYRHSSSPGVGGVTKPDHSQPNPTKVAQSTPDSPGSTGSGGLQIDMTESPTKSCNPPHNETQTVKPATPPSNLPIRRSVSPPADEFDVRPSAPKPPPLIRRGHHCSSDEEDDVFFPPQQNQPSPPIVTPSQEAPSSPNSQTPSSPPTYVPPPTASPSPPPPPPQKSQSHSSQPAHHHSTHGSETEEDDGDKTEATTTPSKTTPTNQYMFVYLTILLPSNYLWDGDNEEGASSS